MAAMMVSMLPAAPPTFPPSFYVGQMNQLLINQGGYRTGGSKVCCAGKAPSCRIETQTAGEDYFEDRPNNRSRVDSNRGSIINWYQIASPQFPHDGMQMAVAPTPPGSKHKFTCAAYCPLQGSKFESAITIGDKPSGPLGVPKDLGPAKVTQAPPGKATALTEHWMWKVGLDAPKHNWSVVMSQEDFFVANRTVPFFHKTTIEPLGSYMGESNTSFLTFTPMSAGAIADHFDVDPDSMTHCKGSSKCDNDEGDAVSRALRMGRYRAVPSRTYLSLAQEMAAKLTESATDVADGRHGKEAAAAGAGTRARRLSEYADVDFPLNYVSVEKMTLRQEQYAHQSSGGDNCCDIDSPGCQVQQQHFEGTRYFDWQAQMQRIENGATGQTVVDDYDGGKSMLVVNVSGVETCKEYCPITLQDDMEPLRLPKAARNKGVTTHEGRPVAHWHWDIKILKFIPMQRYDFYGYNTTVPSGKAAYCLDKNQTCTIPVFATMAITPFGREPPTGYQNTTWLSLKLEVPPAAKFRIAGNGTCPQAQNCGNSAWQAHRLRANQPHTYFHHLHKKQ